MIVMSGEFMGALVLVHECKRALVLVTVSVHGMRWWWKLQCMSMVVVSGFWLVLLWRALQWWIFLECLNFSFGNQVVWTIHWFLCVCLVNTINLNKKLKICYGFGVVFLKLFCCCSVRCLFFNVCVVAVCIFYPPFHLLTSHCIIHHIDCSFSGHG